MRLAKTERRNRNPVARDEVTVLVHGIWMHGTIMQVMGKMLQRAGVRTHQFSYEFLSKNPAENAAALRDEIGLIGARKINLVGHSLGGIVILHLLHEFPDLPIDKIVLIGSPVRGSSVARRIHRNQLLRPLLGRSIEAGLLGGAPDYRADHPLGIITGSGAMGVVAWLFPAGEDSDGVVKASETILAKATDHVSVPSSHSTMIFSRRCTDYVISFLEKGRFQ